MAALGMASEQHHQLDLPIGKVNVYIQGNLASRNVVFLTVHDLGCNHYQYEEFVAHPKILPISQRAVWINVDLPGQGDGEEELPASYTFPTLWSIAESLKNVLDYLNVDHVVLFGEGAGANILARFAMLHDEMVMGAILIHCTGKTASFSDSLRDKLVNWKLKTAGMNPATESFLILHRFGCLSDTSTELELKQAIEHFRENLQHSINPKNLNCYITAYMRRKPLSERLSDLKCSVLLITGALAPQRKGCEKLYEAMMKLHSAKSCATRELVVVENVANVLAERPDKVIESMQYFLQGIGLVSHLKMQASPLSLNRRMSMEDYDKPIGRLQLSGGFRSNLSTPNDIPDETND